MSITLEMKKRLIQTMQEHGISKSELARRMSVSPQKIYRVTHLSHYTAANTLQDAFKAIGVTISLKLVDK